MTDRNALALDFAGLNCRLNGVQADRIEGALGAAGLPEASFDLVVSNLPAKAGAPVLDALIGGCCGVLKEEGLFAFVIVQPLAGLAQAALERARARVTLRRDTREYALFHARRDGNAGREGASPALPADPLTPYLRGRFAFQAEGMPYELETAWNLPDFDTLGYDTELALRLASGLSLPARAGPAPEGGGQAGSGAHLGAAPPGSVASSGAERSGAARALVWNPGQGHVPVYLALRAAGRNLVLAGRDLLALKVSERNLAGRGVAGLELLHLSLLPDLPPDLAETCSLLVMFPDEDPAVRWEETILAEGAALLEEGGALILAASSTSVQRALHARARRTGPGAGFRLLASSRNRGRRAVLLERSHSQRYSPST
jgi:16S rRNA G1207 methylase RsmC